MSKQKLLNRIKTKFSIVAVITGNNILRDAQLAKKLGADIIELRIDSFSRKKIESILDIIKNIRKKIPLPVIGTVRSPIEKGLCQLSDEKRLDIFLKIMPYVDFVDVEISSKSINKKVIQDAHKKDKLVILSYHNFKSTPSNSDLNKYTNNAFDSGADIVKIATYAKNISDVQKLLLFCQFRRTSPPKSTVGGVGQVVAISLGSIGVISRVAGFLFGSCFTYGYIHRSTAPGQMSVKELVTACQFYYSR